MSRKQSLVLGIDVEERTSWGIDSFTFNNLMIVLPNLNDKVKRAFID